MTDAKAPASLAEALAALQAQMPPVGKHASADVRKDGRKLYDYAYAPGEDITPVLYPLMGALGLSFSAKPTMVGDRFRLEYCLRHVSGEADEGEYPLPDPDRYGPQDLGKAITYARRYALCALVGLFPGGDDSDANGMQEAPGPTRGAPRAATARPARPGTAPPAATSTSDQRKRRIAEERARADDAGHDPAKVTRGGRLENDPWETRPMEERENEPGTVNDLQLRAIWMLAKKQGLEDPDTVHAAARTALGLPPDALLTDPDENGEVRESFKRLSHAQAAEFIKQLQDGGGA